VSFTEEFTLMPNFINFGSNSVLIKKTDELIFDLKANWHVLKENSQIHKAALHKTEEGGHYCILMMEKSVSIWRLEPQKVSKLFSFCPFKTREQFELCVLTDIHITETPLTLYFFTSCAKCFKVTF
jgi:hypothetical protein